MPTDVATYLPAQMPDIHRRVVRLEEAQQEVIKKQFQIDTELTGMKRDIQYIRETQDKQTNGINKILWAIGAVFLTYVATFVLDGGLAALSN